MSNHFKNLETLKDLQTIPGVGESIARDFYDIGIKSVPDLKDQDPEKLFLQMCEYQGVELDRFILYIIRSAVYFASTKHPEPDKLNWMHWKDLK